MIEIWAVGGYSEIGCKNMTAIKIDDEVVILDMGYNVRRIVEYKGKEGEELIDLPYEKMLKIEAIPDDTLLHKEWGEMVKAIVVGHGHLDHCGAVRLLAPRYKNAPVVGTPFTIEVIKNLIGSKKIPNRMIQVNPSSKFIISKKITIEMVNMTHSTLQTSAIVIHTPYGAILYANDFKLDNLPILGKKPDYKRIGEIQKKEGFIIQISDSTRIDQKGHTPSETVAKEMLKDIVARYEGRESAVVITTFSSNIARIFSIEKIARQIHREPLLLGRSIANYINAAEEASIYKSDSKPLAFKKQIASALKKVRKNPGKYLIVCTGNQGEPDSTLSRIANNEYPFKFREDDIVIFSSTVIPTPISQENRRVIERKLENKKVRIFRDVHASGHASIEDQKDLLLLSKPKHFIPTHGGMEKLAAATELAQTMGYELGKTVHILQDGKKLVIE